MKTAALFRSIVAFACLFGTVLPAAAGEPTDKIKQTTDRILSIVTDPSLKAASKEHEKRRLIRKAVDERFDWEEMARRSLGRYWAQRSDAEKKEFTHLFSDLVERTYMDKVEGYSGEKVRYRGETVDKDTSAVKVEIETKKNTVIPVEYRLVKRGNDWLVYDISIEGVSLINNYRTQFNSIITQSSYDELIKRLKAKVIQK